MQTSHEHNNKPWNQQTKRHDLGRRIQQNDSTQCNNNKSTRALALIISSSIIDYNFCLQKTVPWKCLISYAVRLLRDSSSKSLYRAPALSTKLQEHCISIKFMAVVCGISEVRASTCNLLSRLLMRYYDQQSTSFTFLRRPSSIALTECYLNADHSVWGEILKIFLQQCT